MANYGFMAPYIELLVILSFANCCTSPNTGKYSKPIIVSISPTRSLESCQKSYVATRCGDIVVGDYVCANVKKFNESLNDIIIACSDNDEYCCSLLMVRNALIETQKMVLLQEQGNQTRYRVKKVMSEFFPFTLAKLAEPKTQEKILYYDTKELFIASRKYSKKDNNTSFCPNKLGAFCGMGNLYSCVLFDYFANNEYKTIKRLCENNIEAMCYAYAEMYIETSNVSESEKEKFYCSQCDKGFTGNCSAKKFQECNQHLHQGWRAYVQYLFKHLGQMETPERFEDYGLSSEDAKKIMAKDVCVYE
jgi:hypothetical protein